MSRFLPYARLVLWLAVLFLIGAVVVNVFIEKKTETSIYDTLEELPPKQAALILGASVRPDGTMNGPLADRAYTALVLYQASKVEKILVSGDNAEASYNEVQPVFEYLTAAGVPETDIYLDYAGFDTYDSIFRAREIFNVESLVIVSQRFHLPRALYIAHSFGIESVGFTADRQLYLDRNFHREWLARLKAFLDVQFGSLPTFLGDPIPIED